MSASAYFSDYYMREMLQQVSSRFDEKAIIETTSLLLLSKLGGESGADFNTKEAQQGHYHPREQRLKNNDVFYMVGHKFGILPIEIDDNKSEEKLYGLHNIQTFDNPSIFNKNHLAYRPIWSGNLSYKTDHVTRNQFLNLNKFYFVPEFQTLEHTEETGEEAKVIKTQFPIITHPYFGYLPVSSMKRFEGGKDNIISAKFTKISKGPLPSDLEYSHDNSMRFYLAYEMLGFNVKNGKALAIY